MKTTDERGAITVEALLSLTLFMMAFLAIVSLATVAKVESTTQYAINQVAKEISQYYYIAQRAGLANSNPDVDQNVKNVDEVVDAIFTFTDKSSDVIENYGDGGNTVPTTAQDLFKEMGKYKDLRNDVEAVGAAAENIYKKMGPVMKNPKDVMASLTTMLTKELGNEVATKIIAQPLCRALVSKYITSDGDADAVLEKMGVVNGIEGLDFRLTNFLTDQRTINIVLVYQIKVNGFGIFDKTLVIKQTASTAAWLKTVRLSEAADSVSYWSQSNFERGKAYVDELQNDNNLDAVKPGKGVDLYDSDSNTFTSVHSINPFSQSYSVQKDGTEGKSADDFVFDEKTLKNTISSKAGDLKSSVRKIGNTVEMEDGTTVTVENSSNSKLIIVVPEEAGKNADNLAKLNKIAEEIQKEQGVTVEFTYRDKVFTEEG